MSVAVRTAVAGRLVRRCAIMLGCVAALAAAPTALGATVPAFGLGSSYKAIVSAGHPAPPAGWELPGFNDSGWSTSAAPFSLSVGFSWGCGFPAGATSFPVNGRVVARKSFVLPAGASSLHFLGTIDNDASVYVNGTLLGSASNGFCTTGGINFTTSSGLVAGTNVVAVVADDFGGGTFFDMRAEYQLAAPVVTANVSGSLGSNGWYTGDVTVSWTLSGGGATSTSGCGPTVVTTDTAGTTFTCTATNAAGADTKSVTIKRDATAPSIAGSQTPPPNGNGWNNTDVTVSFSCADNPGGSGIDTDTVAGATLTSNGAGQSVTNSGTCVDMAGNAAASKTIGGINIDKTAPSIAGSQTPPPNGNGWNNTDVTVSFSCADNPGGSGIDTDTVAGATLTSNGAGQSVTNSGTCVDMAGNAAASKTIGGINIDKVTPVLAPSVAPNPVALNGVAIASANATDVLSGIDTTSCDPVDTSSVGPQSVTCTATDKAGNSATATASYLVYADAPGGGSFVVGNQSATGAVTFWGSQWSKLNSLSGGIAPSSLKGFAKSPAAPSCGSNWSTHPGNSSPPPTGPLPAYMAVIVTSSASKSGSTISGNTVHVVVVRTNAGYDSNPGHAGTGTVVATIC